MDQHKNALGPGYKLHWYQIREILGQGGFGITYLAQDDNLNQPVAIKEYLPVVLAVREGGASVHPVSGEHGVQFLWGLDRFINEAQTLARFRHPNIVRVLTVFKENNTAYMVMEYEQGKPLHEILKDKKFHTEEELKGIILPILNGLDEVHAENFIHRDIKPANIYIRTDGSPVLLDFGSARQSLGEQTQTLTTMISPGYAPFEQYVSNSRKQGPWTDIYGLGATLYRAITGIAPPDSMDRSESLLHTGKDIFVSAREIAVGRYTEGFLSAIDHAMAFRPEDRPQTIALWRKELDAAPVHTLSVRPDDEVITMPVMATGRDAVTIRSTATLKVDKPAVLPVEEIPQTVAPADAGEPFDRAYGFIKKLLKWLLVLFIILVVALVLSRRKSQDVETENTVAPLVMDQGASQSHTVQSEDATPSRVEKLLTAASADLSMNRLASPAGNNAMEKYRKVLELEPRNNDALQGLDIIVSRYLRLMDHALDTGNIRQAQNYLDKATAVNPSHSGIPAARLRLKVASARQSLAAPAMGTEPQTQQTVTGPPSVPETDSSNDEDPEPEEPAKTKTTTGPVPVPEADSSNDEDPESEEPAKTETRTAPATVPETDSSNAEDPDEEDPDAEDSDEEVPGGKASTEQEADEEEADEEETGPVPASVPESQVPELERAKLQSLKNRLRQNPQDQVARKELKALSMQFEEDINEALDTGDYALAKNYIREIQSVTAANSRARRRLDELMRVVEKKEAQAKR